VRRGLTGVSASSPRSATGKGALELIGFAVKSGSLANARASGSVRITNESQRSYRRSIPHSRPRGRTRRGCGQRTGRPRTADNTPRRHDCQGHGRDGRRPAIPSPRRMAIGA
jgi:hypothetical protein